MVQAKVQKQSVQSKEQAFFQTRPDSGRNFFHMACPLFCKVRSFRKTFYEQYTCKRSQKLSETGERDRYKCLYYFRGNVRIQTLKK